MIEVKDRVPLYPGRTRMTPVPGQANVYDMVRVDQPQQVGTPLNRRTMQLLQADIRTYPVKAGESVVAGDVVDVVGGAVSSGRLPVGELAVGSTIKLNVGGKPTEFIVVHHGKPSSTYSNTFVGTTTLLMKDCYEKRQWHTSDVNDYANSAIHSYLNGAFLNLLDLSTKAAIQEVKIPYRVGSGTANGAKNGENGLVAKVFLPAAIELGGGGNQYLCYDGSKYDYFLVDNNTPANNRRIAHYDGAPCVYWTRSLYCDSYWGGVNSFIFDTSGAISGAPSSNVFGVRPALVLPDTFAVYTISKSNVSQAIALQDGTGGQNINLIFDGVAELPGITAGTFITSPGVQGYAPQDGWLWVKPEWEQKMGLRVATGSYIGTQKYGSAKPNKLIFDFTPKLLIVAMRDASLYGGDPWVIGSNRGRTYAGGNVIYEVIISWGSDEVSWYSTAGFSQQLNDIATYDYIAIG